MQDIDVAWSKATIDPELEGSWVTDTSAHSIDDNYLTLNSNFLTFKNVNGAYEVIGTNADRPDMSDLESFDFSNALARTLTFEETKFLIIDTRSWMKSMLNTLQTTGPVAAGGVALYSITENTLTAQTLDPGFMMKAIKQNLLTGTNPKEGEHALPMLSSLDDTTIKALLQLKENKDAWKTIVYKRVDDLEKALEKSRTYPSTHATVANSLVHINSPEFAQLCKSEENVLMRFLQASPEWNVYQEGLDDIVVHRRAKTDDGFRDTSNGYHNNHGVQTRPLFRFSISGSNDNTLPRTIPAFQLDFKQARPTAGDVELKLKKGDQGIESYLAIGEAGRWFEFFEQTQAEERTHTREAVSWLTEFASQIVEAQDEILSTGYAKDLMPPGSITTGEPEMKVVDSNLIVRVNPGEQGYVFLRLFDADTSKPIEDRYYNFAGKEYIGWSTDPQTLFYYQQKLNHLATMPEPVKEIRAELWFRLTNGKAGQIWRETRHPADRKLLEIKFQFSEIKW